MLAIQANEQGHPVLVEVGDAAVVEVDRERWTEILKKGLGDVSETPQAIVPITTEMGDRYSYFNTVDCIKARSMSQMPAIVSEAIERAIAVGCFQGIEGLVAFVSRRANEISNGMEDGDLDREGTTE